MVFWTVKHVSGRTLGNTVGETEEDARREWERRQAARNEPPLHPATIVLEITDRDNTCPYCHAVHTPGQIGCGQAEACAVLGRLQREAGKPPEEGDEDDADVMSDGKLGGSYRGP